MVSSASYADTPKRLMILVFDQMRAEYIERFDLPHFKRAQKMGLNFDNGHVGHLESNTIISHPVMSTGRLPKNLPWDSQVMKDTRGLLGPQNAFYMPSRLSTEQWMKLHKAVSGDTSILARLKKKNAGPNFVVAQKKYAAFNFGGPYADTIICLGDVMKSGLYKGHHKIGGVRVPAYISQPLGNRFYLEGLETWGSEQERYSLHGSGYVTGTDAQRPGGDAWVGDVVEKIMTKEPGWSAILASFGSIDKVSHVLAEHNGPTQAKWALEHGISLEDTLHKADLELGRILDRLEQRGLLAETAIVITADHGGQRNAHFLGRFRPGKHKEDSFYGKGPNFDFSKEPTPQLKPLIATGFLEAVSMDTILMLWTKELPSTHRREFIRRLSLVSGVAEIHEKVQQSTGWSYRRVFRSSRLQGRALEWAAEHHHDLADSAASLQGPDYIAMLFDDHGYAMIGTHGGAQELVQRIPYILLAPGLKSTGGRSSAWVRLVDVNAILGEILQLEPHSELDGTAEAIRPHF